jgi:multiple sugar transport system substrate-binding protein
MAMTTTRRGVVRRGVGLAAGAVGLPLAAACGAAGQGGGDGAPPPVRQAVAVLHWIQYAPPHRFGLAQQAVLDDFQARNPGRVRLEIGESGGSVGLTKVKTAVAAGTPPTSWFGWQVEAADLFALGALVDLNAELRRHRDWARLKGDLIPTLVEGATWKGKLSLVPTFPDPHGLGFNRGQLESAGIPVPRSGFTWNDFLEIGRRGAQLPDRVLFTFEYIWNQLYWWMYANGQRPVSEDRTKVLFDTPAVLQTVEWLHEQVTRTQLARRGKGDFNEGKSLTEVINAGTVTPPRYPNVDPGDGSGIYLTHYPIGPSNSKREIGTSGNVFGFMVFKSGDADGVAAAAEIAAWSVRPDVQLKVSGASGHAPANLVTARDPSLPGQLRDNPLLRTLNDLARYNYPTPNFPRWGEVNRLVDEQLGRVADGALRPKEALEEIQRQAQTLVDEDLQRG